MMGVWCWVQWKPRVRAFDDLSALRRALGPRAPVLFRSVAAGQQGRFDLLPLVEGGALVVPYPNQPGHAQALAQLKARLQSMRLGVNATAAPSESPFEGGCILYLSYEFASVFEPTVAWRLPENNEPLAVLWRAPAVLVRDCATERCTLNGAPSAESLRALEDADTQNDEIGTLPALFLTEDPPEQFLRGVDRIAAYLQAGDIFQANLSRAWRVQANSVFDPDALFQRLCAANPAPFAALLVHAGWALVSSSPERLVSVRNGEVQTRPIAGTRRRDPDPAIDAQLLAELTRDPKERAEHIMLIDLERNDLGRVCEPGTVVVDELGSVETYAHVHHLVSNVRGRLRANIDAWSLLAAVFPGGTITGCPKVRCMQIIHELEDHGRGAYTGSLGYIGDDGSMDFNILIRSLSLREGRIVLRAGAGIVADSVATRELKETRSKARGMLRALDLDL